MCLPSPCGNDGICTESSTAVEGYSCQCKDAWSGRTCKGKNNDLEIISRILKLIHCSQFCFVQKLFRNIKSYCLSLAISWFL